MFTQCPDCGVSFRVTADVLKQAAGMVRCGGCSNAFNALDYLSEQMPSHLAISEAEDPMPDLVSESVESDDDLPKSISAEQSAALLKTLDELAGSNIRIEDTGVEWRVLDKDEADANDKVDEPVDDDYSYQDDIAPIVATPTIDSSDPIIDEFLDESPTPVDQFLTKTPDNVDSAEVFDAIANQPAKTPVEELRFDDNTPIPEDFGYAEEASQPDNSRAEESESAPAPQSDDPEVAQFPEEPPVEMALSDPDEWTDILDEFEDQGKDVASAAEAVAEEQDDDEARLDDEVQLDDEAKPDEEAPLDDEAEPDDGPLDVDTQFALQAEAMGLDVTIVEDLDEEQETLQSVAEDDTPPESEPEPESRSEPEPEPEPESDTDIAPLDAIEEDLDIELDTKGEVEPEYSAEQADETEAEDNAELDEMKFQLVDEPVDELIEEPVVQAHVIEEELAELGDEDEEELLLEAENSGTVGFVEADVDDEFNLPPQTKEEQTVNMQIDQDLMALAIEDEDGFASTIVIPDGAVEAPSAEEFDADVETRPGFETIVMEGESIQSEVDREKLAKDAAAAAEMMRIAKAKSADAANQAGGKRWGMIAAIAGLVLLLVVQVVHQSREALATNELFNQAIGPIYRALGDPLLPEWNVTGWQFEVTQDITDRDIEAAELTIYSRIANKSDGTLPYPLVWISLTDRFQETVGSQVIEPAAYLTENLDPRKHVEPGESFNAVIAIQSPAQEATGFKLNVCYRLAESQMRCAIDDFK